MISGNHVTDFSGNPDEINPTNKAAGNIFGGGGNAQLTPNMGSIVRKERQELRQELYHREN